LPVLSPVSPASASITDSAADGDPLGALRRATRSRHERVDHAMPLSRAGAPPRQAYRAHIALLRTWLQPLHHGLAQADDAGLRDIVVGAGERLAQMQDDLDELERLDGPLLAPVAHGAFPSSSSPAYRWGVAYVIEGSQLGAALLHRRLAATLAPFLPRYLAGDAAGPGPRWLHFIAALRNSVRGEQAVADCCDGACAAFDRLLAPLHATGATR
jgi:heme oxygenase (biliverdin-IX-beta and delta-forming)